LAYILFSLSGRQYYSYNIFILQIYQLIFNKKKLFIFKKKYIPMGKNKTQKSNIIDVEIVDIKPVAKSKKPVAIKSSEEIININVEKKPIVPIVNKNGEHLVKVKGKDVYLGDYVLNVLLKDKSIKVEFPDGSRFIQKKN